MDNKIPRIKVMYGLMSRRESIYLYFSQFLEMTCLLTGRPVSNIRCETHHGHITCTCAEEDSRET